MVNSVEVSRSAEKSLRRLPKEIVQKFLVWVRSIELDGLAETSKRPGLHDEPLKGKRKGQRSVRLSRGYRAVYEVRKNKVSVVFVLEVNNHDY